MPCEALELGVFCGSCIGLGDREDDCLVVVAPWAPAEGVLLELGMFCARCIGPEDRGDDWRVCWMLNGVADPWLPIKGTC